MYTSRLKHQKSDGSRLLRYVTGIHPSQQYEEVTPLTPILDIDLAVPVTNCTVPNKWTVSSW